MEHKGHFSEGETLSLKSVNITPDNDDVTPRRSLGNEDDAILKSSETGLTKSSSKHLDDVFASLERHKSQVEAKIAPETTATTTSPAVGPPAVPTEIVEPKIRLADREILDFTSNRKRLLEIEKLELAKLKEQHQKLLIEATKQRQSKPRNVDDFAVRMAAMSIPANDQMNKRNLDALGKSNEADSEGDEDESLQHKRMVRKSHKHRVSTAPPPSHFLTKQQLDHYQKRPSAVPQKSKSNYSSPVLSTGSNAKKSDKSKPLRSSELQEYLKIISSKGDLTASEINALQAMGISVYRHKTSHGGGGLTSRSHSHEYLFEEPKTVSDHLKPKKKPVGVDFSKADQAYVNVRGSDDPKYAWDPKLVVDTMIEPPDLFNTNKQKRPQRYF